MFSAEGPSLRELAEQALSSTKRGYDLLAPKFDHTPFRTPDAIIEAVLARIPEGREAGLDLCCGTGAGLLRLAERCRRVVGVDFSPGMLEVARQRAQGANVELVEGDVFAFDGGEAFDVVTCFGAFGHVRPRQEPAFVDVIHRALRPGGRFVFASAKMPPRLSRAFLLSKAFNAAMHVRNAIFDPPFVMFYLTFMLPDCATLLEARGFDVAIHTTDLPAPLSALRVVCATKR